MEWRREDRVSQGRVATFGGLGVVVLLLGLALPFGYQRLLGSLFPDYYSYGWNDGAYSEGSTVFPGQIVAIGLGESAIQGFHRLEDVHVEASGLSIRDLEHSGVGQGVIPSGDVIMYKTHPIMVENVGEIRFRLSDSHLLYGQQQQVRYTAKFYFPVVLEDGMHFAWRAKPVQGTITLQIGTKERRQEIRKLFYGFVLVEIVVVSAAIWSCIFALRLEAHSVSRRSREPRR